MMNKKVLLTSLMSIAMLASITTGATYALFTAEDTANIVVKSAKIAVEAEVDRTSMKTYSFDWIDDTGATFENGGIANWDTENGVLTLNRLTPGDGINFNINITNKSNVKIIYRIACGVKYDSNNPLGSKKLANALKATATIDSNVMNFKTESATVWSQLAPESQTIVANINIELPDDINQNDLQDQSLGLYFKVEAIQANGSYEDAYVNDYAGLKDALERNSEAILLNDIVVEDESILANAEIDLNGYKLLNSSNEVIDNFEINEELILKELTYPITIKGNGTFNLIDASVLVDDSNVHALMLEGFNGKIVLDGENTLQGNKNGSAIYVDENSNLDLSGAASLIAIGNNGFDYVGGSVSTKYSTTDDASYAGTGASAIEAFGDINIHDLTSLTANGYGVSGFGIGGNAANITIKNTVIESVRGGFVNTSQEAADYFDGKYNKDEPTGGAAIGSDFSGSQITLENVHIKEAFGGSKAAGIGATYWNATTVTIKNSTIDKVYGGASSAAIGGSRIHQGNAQNQVINIHIDDSNITAFGGYFGAGIGSGYDTYCHNPTEFPITTIEISGNSVITATGGKYAAGIGTGFHAGGLAGFIEDTVEVNASSGEKTYKSTYTSAQDVGFGVTDPNREGLNNTCTFNYKGNIISIPTI